MWKKELPSHIQSGSGSAGLVGPAYTGKACAAYWQQCGERGVHFAWAGSVAAVAVLLRLVI